MDDGLQLEIMDQKVLDRLRLMTGLVEHVSEDTGEVLSHSVEYEPFVIDFVEGKVPRATIRGSLHKFWTHGNNDTLFTFAQVRKAVESLAWKFSIDLRMPCLQRIEFGVNIHAKSPETIIDAAVLYNGRGPYQSIRDKKHYHKVWKFTDYSVKLYCKGPSIVRFEVHVTRLRWLKNLRIRCLDDLRSKDVFVGQLFHLISCADDFLFVPTRNDSLPAEIREKWAQMRDVSNWLTLKPYEKTRQKHWVQDIINRYDLVSWTAYMKKNILRSGAQMLEIDEPTLCAMFSTLGLDVETVAGPIGDCDRLADSDQDVLSSSFRSGVLLNHSVANGGMSHTLEVVRLYRDVHLGGRGPPGFRCKDTERFRLI